MTLDELKSEIDGLILNAVTPDLDYENVVRLEELALIRNALERVENISTVEYGGPLTVKINGHFAFTAEELFYEADLDNGRSVNITTPDLWV